MKRVLHIPFTWFPAACGGTEVYVRGLIRELPSLGWSSQVAVPAEDGGKDVLDGVLVHRIQMPEKLTQAALYGAGEVQTARGFAEVLDAEKPDVVHFHAYSPAVSVLWLEAARQRGLPCVYTYHTPTMTCMRGTLMRWGHTPCDGEMRPLRCSACMLHGLGVGGAASWALTLSSPVMQHVSGRVPFRAWPLVRRRTEAALRWLAGQSRVIGLCRWGGEVMRRNGVTAELLRIVRHGLAVKACEAAGSPRKDSKGSVKIGFFGRLDVVKGLHVLAAALRHAADLRLELHCHLVREKDIQAGMQDLLNMLMADARVRIHLPVSPDEVVQTMAGYDAVAVPSTGLETGPLVMLEAFAAGVPVLGSDLGGIAEWVTHEENGLLAPAGDAVAWAETLRRFTLDSSLRERLRAGIKPPPTMTDVARKMDEIYRELLC